MSRRTIWIAALLFCAVVWAGVVTAMARVVIDYDLGGVVADYLSKYMNEGPEEIRGVCMSACTLALSDPRTCVQPNAYLGFHAASNANGTRFMFLMYPPPVRDWIASHGGLMPTMIYLTGREAIRLGVPACPASG